MSVCVGKFICELRLMRKKLRLKVLIEMLPVTVEKSQSRVKRKKLMVKILLENITVMLESLI